MSTDGYDTISFLSDYGLVDEFVGVVKSVIRQLAPSVTVIDISHEVPAHDVRSGGLTLARSAQYLAPGVVLAVVDPGVGTDRRGVAVEVGDGASILVGPDNGLLAPAVGMLGGATRAVELVEPRYRLQAPGSTFDGRDVFGPAAAHLCAGVAMTELGPEIDTVGMRPGLIPITREEHGGLVAEVLWADRYGNLQLNVDPADVAAFGERIRLRFGSTTRTGVRAEAYADVLAGQIGLIVDSYGLLSIAVDRLSAAEELGLGPGDEVVLAAIADDDGEPASTGTPVVLGERHAG